MIEVKDISKSFGDKKVLENISATFKPGITSLIIGGSGSGKTTLLKCMVGLHTANTGQVLYSGSDFTQMDFKERIPIRKEIGMLFQGSALFDSMNVEQNVMFPMNMFTNMTLKEKRERVDFCLKRVNLDPGDVNGKMPSELSGGMKKRVGIARAIALKPKYLFCDEPNSGLDPLTALVIDKLIDEITDEYQMTTVVVTHDMNSVMEIGENIIFLYQGKKWWEGTKEDIRKTDNKELNEFVFATAFAQSLKE
ncbi:MAG TPA: ATP-binding cassette domain-containing protein [Anseongella sp.]|nr:ATP-binding cassette domain-containing protein [Anseongella sp.]